MGYAETPKGLIPFHRGERGPRTAFEEHLLGSGRRFVRAADGSVRAHFTVAAEHVGEFEAALEIMRPRIEEGGCRLRADFSIQQKSTDTLALDASGAPFRSLRRIPPSRPAGHGALLGNLEAIEGDLVSIRNIDNVVPDEASGDVVRWKRILAGLLVREQSEIFEILEACEKGAGEPTLDRGLEIARERFGRLPERPLASARETRAFLRASLDRPLRVCGVVRNEGEPGGGPFWVRGRDGRLAGRSSRAPRWT